MQSLPHQAGNVAAHNRNSAAAKVEWGMRGSHFV